MHIHFGQTFNGNRSLTLPDSLGQQVLGPTGLLNLLETHLGLLVFLPTQSERIVQFRNVLNVCKKKRSIIRRVRHRTDTTPMA